MINQTAESNKANRIHWMDNLRSITIFLVVLYHVGGVYEAAGLWGWFWIVDDPNTMSWVGIVGIMFDIMVMPTMFFIAGYLTPTSLSGKTQMSFIIGKLKRLLIPWFIAVVTLIPIYKVIFLYSRGLPQEHWTTYFHISNPNSQNWLWFLPVLFIFNLVYLLISRFNLKLPKMSLKMTIGIVFLIGFIYSFTMGSIFGMRSWTLTPLLDFENERLLLYFMTFLLGSYCFNNNTFLEKPKSKVMYNVVNGIAWIPVTAHIFLRLLPFFYPDGFNFSPVYIAGWWLSFNFSLLALLYVMIESFRRYLDFEGKIWKMLNQNSYGVYIIHVIMIGIFGTILLGLDIPTILKYLLLILFVYGFSNVLVSAYYYMKQRLT